MFYCGIDLASRVTAVCVVDESDRIVLERTVASERAALARALCGFEGALCLVEAAPLAEWCKRELEALGHRCEIIDTRAAKGFFEARKKTDQRDARTLARMARARWYNAVHAKSAQARLLRTRLTARQGLVRMKVGIQNQVRGLLRAQGVRVGKIAGAGFARAIRERLAGQAELLAVVVPLLRVWERVAGELRETDQALHREGRGRAEVQRLMQVPGVGVLTALGFIATLDEPRRFTNADQVGDYFGLAPGVYQSGDLERRGRITRQGDALMRALLVEAANSVLYRYRKPWTWKRWAEGLRERKGAGKARVALARRLAGLLWRLWKDETAFRLQLA